MEAGGVHAVYSKKRTPQDFRVIGSDAEVFTNPKLVTARSSFQVVANELIKPTLNVKEP